MAVRSRIRIETLFLSSALGIAAAAICLMLFLLVPSGVDSQSPKDPEDVHAPAPQAGQDDFTVSTTEKLVSSQTWRSRYAVPVSLGVLIVTYAVAHRRISRADRSAI